MSELFGHKKKNVTLRGDSRKEQTKDDLLAKARVERQNRENERRRLKATTQIQAHFRAKRQLAALNSDLRQQYDQDWSQFQKILPQQRDHEAWRKLLRSFFLFFRPTNDTQRLSNIVNLMNTTQVVNGIPTSFELRALHEQPILFAVFRTARLALHHLPLNSQTDGAYVLLSRLCLTKSRLIELLVMHGAFERLHPLVRDWVVIPGKPPIGLALSIAFVNCTPTSLLNKFVDNILSVPLLSLKINNKLLADNIQCALLASARETIISSPNMAPASALWILGNACNLFAKAQGHTAVAPTVVRGMLMLVAAVSDQVNFRVLTKNASNTMDTKPDAEPDSDSDDSTSDATATTSAQRAASQSGRTNTSVLESVVPASEVAPLSDALALLGVPTLVKAAMDFFSVNDSTPTARENEIVAAIIKMTAFPIVGKQFLNTLVFSSGILAIQVMWSSIQKQNILRRLCTKEVLEARSDSQEVMDMMSALALFCMCMSQKLVAIDDAEFFEKQTPLPLSTVTSFSHHLLIIATWLLWAPRPSSTRSHLRRHAITLLHQLYDRDSRRSFCGPNHWINAEIRPDLLLREMATQAQTCSDPNHLFPPFASVQPTVSSFAAVEDVSSGVGAIPDLDSYASMFEKVLAVLRYLPFVISFEVRVSLFRFLVDVDRKLTFGVGGGEWRDGLLIAARRANLYKDAYDQLAGATASQLKQQLRVGFVNREGLNEAGVGPGVAREFLQEVLKDSFNPEHGLFTTTSEHQLYPSPHAFVALDNPARHFAFAGRMLGKSLYEKQLVLAPLSRFFLNHLLGRRNSVSDLISLDTELYKNLIKLKSCDDVTILGLDFTLSAHAFGLEHTHELKPNGANIAVTNENYAEYVYLVAHYRLDIELRTQCESFISGLADMIPLHWLRMFSPEELQMLITGTHKSIDVHDLRRHTNYAGYTEDDEMIAWFWRALAEMPDEQKRQFLRFVTSSDRAPLMGFAHLYPNFGIQRVSTEEGSTESRLPSAATCMNLLKLPEYDSFEKLREKLLYAISQANTFELT